MTINVDIGGYAISENIEDIIKTYALGSCVAVTVYAAQKRMLGMAHIALPDSSINTVQDKTRPAYFADQAVPLLLEKFLENDSIKKNELFVKLFGGAQTNNENDIFKIGQRNLQKVREILDRYHLIYDWTQTGGNFSRTLEMDVETGTPKLIVYPLKI